tara:strand:- start:470 stop:1066 length:597 start_codon:yes stop_codon:yes gene_type:complete
MIKKNLFIASIVICTLTAGCSTHVVVMSEHPSILIEPLPYKIGLVLDDTFTKYSFTRKKEDEKIIISLGDSQTELFDKIFDSMFPEVIRFQSKPLAEQGTLKLYVIASVDELQLSLPKETSVNVFEVWIKYKLEIFDQNGSLITEWLISSYGRTQTRFLKSQKRALNQATKAALRDAGAQIIVGFKTVPAIRDWIDRE